MSSVRVDLDDLTAAARHLRAAVAVAREVAGAAGPLAGGVGDCGSAPLAGAAADFLGAWGHGMGLVATDADVLGAALEQAAAAYRQVDAAVAAGPGRP